MGLTDSRTIRIGCQAGTIRQIGWWTIGVTGYETFRATELSDNRTIRLTDALLTVTRLLERSRHYCHSRHC